MCSLTIVFSYYSVINNPPPAQPSWSGDSGKKMGGFSGFSLSKYTKPPVVEGVQVSFPVVREHIL